MTMLVLIQHKDFVLLAADKRAVYIKNGRVESVVSDDVDKIANWKGGFISGCGYAPWLNEVKNFSGRDNMDNIHAVSEYLKNMAESSTCHDYWVSQTKIVAIYKIINGFRAVYSEAEQSGVRALSENQCLIIVKDVETSFFKDRIEKLLSEKNTVYEDIIQTLSELFHWVSTQTNTVSRQFDLALINEEVAGTILLNTLK